MLLLFIIFTSVQLTLSSLLVSSQVKQHCVRQTPNFSKSSCNPRLILVFLAENSQENSEYVTSVIDVTNETSGQKLSLRIPVRITFKKSTIAINYKCFYLKTFDGDPREKVVHTGAHFLFKNCVDDPRKRYPTCGLYETPDGRIADASEGFCCTCDPFSNSQVRLNKPCGFKFESGAVCMVPGKTMYSAFKLSPPDIVYKVTLEVTTGNYTRNYELSPFDDVQKTENNIKLKLEGDLFQYETINKFSDKVLFVPENRTDNADKWLLVDQTAISWNGLECGKIGASFYAHKHQPGRCEKRPNSCFENSIRDIERRGENFLVNFGLSATQNIPKNGPFGPAGYCLTLNSDRPHKSILTVELDAQNFSYVFNKATGVIYATESRVNLTSASKDQNLTLVIENTGAIMAQFILSLSKCEPKIIFAPAVSSHWIEPGENRTVAVNVWSFETRSTEESQCVATLKDSSGEVLDSKNLTIFVRNAERTGQIYKPAPGGYRAEPFLGVQSAVSDCLSKNNCNFVDLKCYFWGGCYKEMLLFGFVSFLLLVVLAMIVKRSFK